MRDDARTGERADKPATAPPRVLQWAPGGPPPATTVDAAVEALRRGELIVLPTDTVYGLAAHPDFPGAIEQVFQVKERPAEKELPLLVASAEQVATFARVSSAAAKLMRTFWPGGLTLVVARTRGKATVAVRMPDHPVPLAIIAALRGPLATTSANRSGQPSCTTADAVRAQLPRGYALLIDSGPSSGGIDSTVLDVSGEYPVLLRAGAVATAAVEQCVGPIRSAR